MSPLLAALLIIVVAAMFVAAVSIYVSLRREAEAVPKDENLSESELRARYEAARSQRVAAQERLFSSIEATREGRAQRAALNAQPYDTDTIDPALDSVWLLRLFRVEEDAYAALVYLLADDPGPVPEDESAFAAYFAAQWAQPEAAMWVWQGDNYLEEYSELSLRSTARERQAQMRAILNVSGWQIAAKDDFNDDILEAARIHLKRRPDRWRTG
ncbi:MAG: hypothetical protein ACOCXZ_02205 [Chloroflexota bacterium]